MSETQTAVAPVALTKDEKLAKIKAQIAKLEARYDDIFNDRAPVKAAKVVFIPEIGAKVIATIGRNTPTTQAKAVEGTVVAIKPAPTDGKGSAQVRVRIFEGSFEEQLVTLYPAQLAPVPVEGESA